MREVERYDVVDTIIYVFLYLIFLSNRILCTNWEIS